MKKYTVLWGNIGDGVENRLDHVETDGNPVHAAQAIAAAEMDMPLEDFANLYFDGYAIFDGHLKETSDWSFI